MVRFSCLWNKFSIILLILTPFDILTKVLENTHGVRDSSEKWKTQEKIKLKIILCLINDKEKSELTPTVKTWELRDTFTGAVEGSKLSIILPCKPNLVYQNIPFSLSWIAYSRYC